MDRNEAVLRELKLYPLWQRRGEPAPVAAAQTVQAPGYAALTRPAQLPAQPVSGITVDGPVALPAAPATADDKSREQRIGELGWPQLKAMVRDCAACKLRAGCAQTVFGVGDEQAEWLFVGEGPGADEDAQGEPFVGQAGKLLDNMLLAIKLRRGQNVYIANIVKCRPPVDVSDKQLPPKPDEIATCLPYLQRQIGLIKPKIIVALGKTAATALLGKDAALGSLRGTVHDYCGIPLIVTYHPAYLLRSPPEKAKAWQDLCFAVQAHQPQGRA
ncbi:MAG: DNA polymerase III [Gallionellales bacterium RIFCSPLOWO2_12_FULL_59_22]|nr:MAG: DNA polymerase III [Gallionellales bacterium RIFCSPLOWO2_02_FULL_59_110]OGT02065.1 MAG: DNA polymerase III [Gallionellales bacterium RIFCSPLOWO2_02_58_13]OGT13438.1 MAG: DNA polymerase III [Gallionellales bacterium RIFCSPLOWO2_12_FULL_59_22]